MQLHSTSSTLKITDYVPNQYVNINGNRYSQQITIIQENIDPRINIDLSRELPTQLKAIESQNTEILVIGTGAEMQYIAESLYYQWLENNIGVEIMPTRSALSTIKVLSSETRMVSAFLII